MRLGLFFKDFAAWIRSSCVGLNVAGFTTAKVLREAGIDVCVFPVRNNVDIVNAIDKQSEIGKPLTHVVISAPWLTEYEVRCLVSHFSSIEFVILSHSNVGFLQADPSGVELIIRYLKLTKEYPNLMVGGNSAKFAMWLEKTYGKHCPGKIVYLPNLYPIENPFVKAWSGQAPIKIGAFGAVRPEKNFMTAAAAAVLIATITGIPVELHMSSGGEGDQGRTSPAIEQMVKGADNITLIRHDWMFWDQFVQLIGEMDLLIQVSYTESFNMVTADGISQGVPSVVSPAITWCPDSWKADPDNVIDVAEVGIDLLYDFAERSKGVAALQQHNAQGIQYWKNFLGVVPETFFKKIKKRIGWKR